ncbi:MAG: hypothetical protein CVV02_08885 [Firmicutes bacterium HGW-Firmicutes-7]|nr:MAG: hypothetical protein CVV02_08885 [Firmicutes bacterium HGW-Firmicutes-7]
MTAKKEDVNKTIDPKKILKNNIIITTIFAIAVMSILIIGFGKAETSPNDEMVVFDSVIKTLFLDTYETTSEIEFAKLDTKEFSDPQVKQILNMMKDINIKATHRYNKLTSEFELIFDVRVKDVSTVKGHIYAHNNIVAIDIPLLYSKPLYMTDEVFLENYGLNHEQVKILSSNLKDKIVSKSYESIQGFEAESYVDLFLAFISNTLTESLNKQKININDDQFKGTLYVLNADTKDLLDITNNILNTMLDDRKLAYVMNRINSTFLFNENTIEQLEIDDYLQVNIDSTFFIDKRSVVRKSGHNISGTFKGVQGIPINYELNVNTTVSKANETTEFHGINLSNAINISELTEDELEIIYKDIEKKLSIIIDKNRLYELLQMDKEINP